MKKILIVDDSTTIANAMQRFLAAAGYEVDTRYESETFFDGRATEFDPDLLILDVNMPHFDGFYVLEMARKQKTCPRAKIMMCSTKIFEQDLNRAKSLGADEFLIKPFNADQLLSKVSEVIGTP
jgi:DNA-binding response OmpR family regulator